MSTTRCLQLLASRRSRPSANLLPLLTIIPPHSPFSLLPLAALRFSHILCTPATYSRPAILQTGGQKCLFRTKRGAKNEPRHSVNKAEPAANENTTGEIKIRNSAASKSEQNEPSSQAGQAKSAVEEPAAEETESWDKYKVLQLMQRRPGEEELASLAEKIISQNTAAPPPQALAPQAPPPSAQSTNPSKTRVEDVFRAGIKYQVPRPLLRTSGTEWAFQPHPNLYETLATNVFQHYAHYKRDEIDKTYIPSYFYVGGARTGKSRSASEFASSLREAIEIEPHAQHPLYHELSQRLKAPFIFHVSFENGTSLGREEFNDLWNAIGIRMLHQLLDEPFEVISNRYSADPRAIFRLVAAAENVDLFNNFTGILIIDGVQSAFIGPNDGMDKQIAFYGLLSQISGLSLMSRRGSLAKEEREAPFIMTCVTATHFGPIQQFLADSHRNRVYLPLNRLDPPTWKKDNLLVFDKSPVTRLLIEDLGGHARAIELLADELAHYQNKPQPNITDLANKVYVQLQNRYHEALSALEEHILPIVQCILSRQQINPRDLIPGSNRRWEEVTAHGLI